MATTSLDPSVDKIPATPSIVDGDLRPALSFFQIWNMCFGFLGIQFGFALQNANVSRIFQTLGAEIEEMAILWIAAPLTGLLVQPIVGYYSDRTWTRLGRRRPYFLVGAVLSTLALIAMPNSPTLWIAAGMLWILDASINITMEPFRAFVGDNLPGRQRVLGYSMQSFFIGVGAVVASSFPWLLSNVFEVSNTAATGQIPDSVRYAFYAGGVVMLVSVVWTVIGSKEYDPATLAAFKKDGDKIDAAEATPGHASPNSLGLIKSNYLYVSMASAIVLALLTSLLQWDKQLFILAGMLFVAPLLAFIALALWRKGHRQNFLVQICNDMIEIPSTMKQLAIVQFFSWFALFSMWIYSTSAITSYHYNTSDVQSVAFNEGADWVGILFAVYNLVAALFAFLLPIMADAIGAKKSHASCLLAGALGFLSMFIIKDPSFLWISMIGVGIAWTSILAMPYAMLSASVPSEKMGVYMGIFNFFIVIPQLLAASILGLVLSKVFAGQAIFAYGIGACCFILAAFFTMRVKFQKQN